MSEFGSNFFSELNDSPSLFLDEDELNPEEETAVLDGSAALLDRSMPLIHFDERLVLFFCGLSEIDSGHCCGRAGDSKLLLWLQRDPGLASQKLVCEEPVATSTQAGPTSHDLGSPEDTPSLEPQLLQQQGGGDMERYHPETDQETLDFMSKKRFSANTDRKVTWAANLYHDWHKKRLDNILCDLRIKGADIDCLSKLDKTNLSFALSNFINEIKRHDGIFLCKHCTRYLSVFSSMSLELVENGNSLTTRSS